MTDDGGLLVVIPARGGSKRLPRKNILPLVEKPLICWTIEAALDARLDAHVMVTSDDEQILAIARQYASRGIIAHKRPDQFATDTASTVDVLIDAVRARQMAGHLPQTILVLQPTSPLRTAEDIRAALDVYRQAQSNDTVVTVCEVEHPTAWVGTLGIDSRLEGVGISNKRSQDYEKEYRLNGAVYIISTDMLLKKGEVFTETLRASIMPRERSLDIDTDFDFRLCESILRHSLGKMGGV